MNPKKSLKRQKKWSKWNIFVNPQGRHLKLISLLYFFVVSMIVILGEFTLVLFSPIYTLVRPTNPRYYEAKKVGDWEKLKGTSVMPGCPFLLTRAEVALLQVFPLWGTDFAHFVNHPILGPLSKGSLRCVGGFCLFFWGLEFWTKCAPFTLRKIVKCTRGTIQTFFLWYNESRKNTSHHTNLGSPAQTMVI